MAPTPSSCWPTQTSPSPPGEAATGRFANAGQACTSSKRFFVEEAVWDAFLEEFLAQARQWTLGDPSNSETKLGPMASLAARADLEAQVDDAVSKGATVHLGGAVPDGPGAFYPATVLTGVDPTDACLPGGAVRPGRRPVPGELRRAGGRDRERLAVRPRSRGLRSRRDQGREVADQLEVGMVGINTTIKSAPDMPFGGVKSSGVGRELGRFGLDEFANKKLVRVPAT